MHKRVGRSDVDEDVVVRNGLGGHSANQIRRIVLRPRSLVLFSQISYSMVTSICVAVRGNVQLVEVVVADVVEVVVVIVVVEVGSSGSTSSSSSSSSRGSRSSSSSSSSNNSNNSSSYDRNIVFIVLLKCI